MMRDRQLMPVAKAVERVERATDELEELLNRHDGTPGKKDKQRRAELASTLMSLLAEWYEIVPPYLDQPVEPE